MRDIPRRNSRARNAGRTFGSPGPNGRDRHVTINDPSARNAKAPAPEMLAVGELVGIAGAAGVGGSVCRSTVENGRLLVVPKLRPPKTSRPPAGGQVSMGPAEPDRLHSIGPRLQRRRS
jgi:hypothetical protein